MKKKYTNILVAIDGSEQSDKALGEAIEVARRNNGKLTALNIIDVTQFATDPYAVEGMNIIMKENAESIRLVTEKIIPKDISYEIVTESGKPRLVIVDFAKFNNNDLIVIGATGTGKFERLVLGSTTAYVVNNAHCNVMVVR